MIDIYEGVETSITTPLTKMYEIATWQDICRKLFHSFFFFVKFLAHFLPLLTCKCYDRNPFIEWIDITVKKGA